MIRRSKAPMKRPRKSIPSFLIAGWSILKFTGTEWVNDSAMRLSAAISFYSILSLAPMLILISRFAGQSNQGLSHAMTGQVSNLMGQQAANAMKPILEHPMSTRGGKLAMIAGPIVLLVSATGVFVELQDSMNTIWGVKPRRDATVWQFIRHRLLSLAMVFGSCFLVILSLIFSGILSRFVGNPEFASRLLAWTMVAAAPFVIVTILFLAIFKFLPDTKVEWKFACIGALLAAAMFVAGKSALAFYFSLAKTGAVYGAAGPVIVVLVWIYYSSFSMFFGAEFTKALTRYFRPGKKSV
jgi:membrane protein